MPPPAAETGDLEIALVEAPVTLSGRPRTAGPMVRREGAEAAPPSGARLFLSFLRANSASRHGSTSARRRLVRADLHVLSSKPGKTRPVNRQRAHFLSPSSKRRSRRACRRRRWPAGQRPAKGKGRARSRRTEVHLAVQRNLKRVGRDGLRLAAGIPCERSAMMQFPLVLRPRMNGRPAPPATANSPPGQINSALTGNQETIGRRSAQAPSTRFIVVSREQPHDREMPPNFGAHLSLAGRRPLARQRAERGQEAGRDPAGSAGRAQITWSRPGKGIAGAVRPDGSAGIWP